jgi:hypothetical protein
MIKAMDSVLSTNGKKISKVIRWQRHLLLFLALSHLFNSYLLSLKYIFDLDVSTGLLSGHMVCVLLVLKILVGDSQA